MLSLNQIPEMLPTALMDGDVVLQIADHGLFGDAARLAGQADADAKGVPLCQHLLVATTKRAGRYFLESSWSVRERALNQLDKDTYIVLRHKTAHPAEIQQAIAWGRTQINNPYGYINLFRVAMQLLLHIKLVSCEGEPYEICSEFAGEMFEHAGLALEPTDDDANLKPWDYLVPPVFDHFDLMGRFTP